MREDEKKSSEADDRDEDIEVAGGGRRERLVRSFEMVICSHLWWFRRCSPCWPRPHCSVFFSLLLYQIVLSASQ